MSKNSLTKTHAPLPSPRPRWRSKRLGAVASAVIALGIVASMALPDNKKSGPRVTSGVAPAFAERDLLSGQLLSNASLRGKDVLLFFSEGIMCQACFEQIQSRQARAGELNARGLLLVNITTDEPDVLRQAAVEYGITTPLISDAAGQMSTAYGAIGQGMHPNTDGHTFVLLDRQGRIRWRRDYATMFVPPDKLLAVIPQIN